MFDISALKEMKLSELQEIAKATKIIKFNGVKKDTLVSQILEHQAANGETATTKNVAEDSDDDKPKRVRIVPVKKVAIQKTKIKSLFEVDETPVNNVSETLLQQNESVKDNENTVIEAEDGKKVSTAIKFNKSAYEKKIFSAGNRNVL